MTAIDKIKADRHRAAKAAKGFLRKRSSLTSAHRALGIAEGLNQALNYIEADGETYTRLHVEAALCLWEAALEIRLSGKRRGGRRPAYHAALLETWDGLGTVEMRHACIELGPWACQVFDLIPEDVRGGHAFDWELIPAMLARVVWRPNSQIVYERPTPEETADALIAQFPPTPLPPKEV